MNGARPRWRGRIFVALMLALTLLFAGLGVWQWQRLGEKEAEIATIAARMNQPPIALPAADTWPTLEAADLDYRPVTISGKFMPNQTVLVFTSLAEPRGTYGGPGYWVMTPFALETGGTVLVNRGFIPQDSRDAYAQGSGATPGVQTLSGIARRSEEPGPFTPATDAANRIEWVRDVDRLADLVDPSLAPFAPVYVDLPAGEPGALPQGGETVLTLPNNHLGYALTWFGFALLTPVLLAFWLRRRRGAGG